MAACSLGSPGVPSRTLGMIRGLVLTCQAPCKWWQWHPQVAHPHLQMGYLQMRQVKHRPQPATQFPRPRKRLTPKMSHNEERRCMRQCGINSGRLVHMMINKS